MHGGAGVLTLSEVAPGNGLHCCLEYLEMREGLTEGVPLFPLPGALGFSCDFAVSLHHLLLDFKNAFPPFCPPLHNLPQSRHPELPGSVTAASLFSSGKDAGPMPPWRL